MIYQNKMETSKFVELIAPADKGLDFNKVFDLEKGQGHICVI